jgi:hypothetical protein
VLKRIDDLARAAEESRAGYISGMALAERQRTA